MYGKLFSQMYDGTLATRGPWQALATFQQLIILADKHGVVDMTVEAIARRTTFPLRVIQLGIAELEKPDPDSRTPDEEGRRIVRLSDTRSWGWRLVNYEHYRLLRMEEDRRAYHRQYWREKRSPNRPTQMDSTPSTESTNAVSIMHGSKKPPARRKIGGDAYATGLKIFGEIRNQRVETRTACGSHFHLPKEVIDSLPPRARAAVEAVGGSAAFLLPEVGTGLRVLRSQFARVYANED